MNHMVLHVCYGQSNGQHSWQGALTERQIALYRAQTPQEARYYNKSYPMMAILIELPEGCSDEALETIRELRSDAHPEAHPAMIGLHNGPLQNGELAVLCEAGLCTVLDLSAPDSMVLWQLETIRNLHTYEMREESGMTVSELAKITRQQLHDISQPLSAVQGRLQLMMVKTTPDDPNYETYKLLVELIQRMGHQIGELHQTHRTHS